MRFEDVRGQRYTEIFLIGGHAITHHLIAGVYNTIGMNDPAGIGDTCPQDVLDKIDVEDLKEKYDLQADHRQARHPARHRQGLARLPLG